MRTTHLHLAMAFRLTLFYRLHSIDIATFQTKQIVKVKNEVEYLFFLLLRRLHGARADLTQDIVNSLPFSIAGCVLVPVQVDLRNN